jgi:hypothetical protein
MNQRVLSVSLSHVIRCIATLLLPISFLSLIAWATAGSDSGSTTDPIRGASWIWMGLHHLPFQLAFPPTGLPGYLTYLPIGGVVIPFLSIRISFNRALDRLQGDYHDLNLVRLTFSLWYTLFFTVIAYVSASPAIRPQWYLAPIISFALSLLATISTGSRVRPTRALHIALRMWAIMCGTAFLLLTILLILDFDTVKTITITLDAGLFGGILLLILNLLYLPNAAIALLSYFAGTGFAVGAGTVVAPIWYELGQLPALPLLGIVPTGTFPWALFGILFFIGIGALLARLSLHFGLSTLVQSYIFTVALAVLIGYLASGSLMTAEMGAMGVSIWKFAASIALEVGLGAGATTFLMNRQLQVKARS